MSGSNLESTSVEGRGLLGLGLAKLSWAGGRIRSIIEYYHGREARNKQQMRANHIQGTNRQQERFSL